jgi:mRNA interferase HigB
VIILRIIKPSRVRQYAKAHPDAAGSLMAWLKIARKGKWSSIQETRQVFPHADGLKVASGNTVTVFNIGGNKYRLIVAIHYGPGNIFVLRFLGHAEYDRQNWKAEL